MKPDREQCLKWAEEAGFFPDWAISNCHNQFEALCRTVWNVAIEEAAQIFVQPYREYEGRWIVDDIRKLKVKS